MPGMTNKTSIMLLDVHFSNQRQSFELVLIEIMTWHQFVDGPIRNHQPHWSKYLHVKACTIDIQIHVHLYMYIRYSNTCTLDIQIHVHIHVQ